MSNEDQSLASLVATVTALENAGFGKNSSNQSAINPKPAPTETPAVDDVAETPSSFSAATETTATEAVAASVPAEPPADFSDITVDLVSQMFPRVAHGNIEKYLPVILSVFQEMGMTDRELVLMALATIRAETAGFVPISEYKSRYNTSGQGHDFDKYDNRNDIGNRGAPDGALFKGRGFIQLTGRSNYTRYSQLLKLGTLLVDDPEQANDPVIAAKILARFILDKKHHIKNALAANNLKKARRLVNGGSHGLRQFSRAYRIGEAALFT